MERRRDRTGQRRNRAGRRLKGSSNISETCGNVLETLKNHPERSLHPPACEPHPAGSAGILPAFGDSSPGCNVKDVHHGLHVLAGLVSRLQAAAFRLRDEAG